MAEQVGGDPRGGTSGHQHDIPPVSSPSDVVHVQTAVLSSAKEQGERGLELFLEERYEEARKCFEAACTLDPADVRWRDLHERAVSNHTARYHLGLRSKPVSAATLLAPPALALREPLGLAPMLPEPGVSRRLLASVMKIAGLVFGAALEIGVRIIGGKGQEQTWESWPKRRNYFLRDLGLAAIRNYMNHHTLQDPYPGTLVGHQYPGQRRPEWTERYRTATGA